MIPTQDIEALFDLIEREGEKLREIDPDNALLEFLQPVLTSQWPDEDVGDRFLARFDPEENRNVVQVRVAYLLALREATGNVEVHRAEPRKSSEDRAHEGVVERSRVSGPARATRMAEALRGADLTYRPTDPGGD